MTMPALKRAGVLNPFLVMLLSMKTTTLSKDQTQISYELSGKGDTALLFAHGWLGNKHWWDLQRSYFSDSFQVAALDLAGHGDSGKTRTDWSSTSYADDIVAVAKALPVKNIILIGHSMSGAYSTEAALRIPNLKALILVDTLKDLDQQFTIEQMAPVLDLYRKDFNNAVLNMIPQYLFVETTPPDVKKQLQNEFLTHEANFAATCLEPLYKTDFRQYASQVKVPVRAINSDVGETSKINNSKYYQNFDYSIIKGVGHYPMLEKPEEFNLALDNFLKELN